MSQLRVMLNKVVSNKSTIGMHDVDTASQGQIKENLAGARSDQPLVYLPGTPYDEIMMLSDAPTWFNNMQPKSEVAHECPAKLGFTAELSLEEYLKIRHEAYDEDNSIRLGEGPTPHTS